MAPYQGHRSRNAWNVALWISNDEPLYQLAMDCLKRADNNPAKATRLFLRDTGATRTPDGAKYNPLSVRLALAGLIE